MPDDRARRIARAMLRFIPRPTLARVSKRPDLSGWGLPIATARFLEKNPNALLMGAVFDRLIAYQKAWQAPVLLMQRLGHFDVNIIAQMKPQTLAKYIGRYRGSPSLHRITGEMAVCIVDASRRLVDEYDGDAANIWCDDPGAKVVLRRLQQFRGIGQKIANMMVRILVANYGVRLAGWDKIDIAVDRHVGRVFLRTGLVAGKKKVFVGEIRAEAIAVARRLSPRFPGALDEPAFVIGFNWCTAEEARCNQKGNQCPLVKACPQTRRAWAVI